MTSCGWPMMIGMFVVWTLVVGAVAAGVFFLVRGLRDRGAEERDERSSTALTILEERYARGEVDEEEFVRRREALFARR